MKDTLTEVKNKINSRIDEANNHISDLKDKKTKNTQSEQDKKRIKNK